MHHIYVIGLDELNHRWLRRLPQASDYEFHQLLTFAALQKGPDVPIGRLIETATAQLAAADAVDAIVSYWDFPGTLLVPILARRFDCPSPTLEAVLKCEHKYWSRREQAEVTDACPAFQQVDPYAAQPLAQIRLDYPFWIKPVKSFSSHLSYRVRNDRDFHAAVAEIREKLPRIGEPFNEVLRMAELPPAVAAVDGYHCIAEADVTGLQCTLEGYLHDGRLEAYGLVDSHRYADSSAFARYEYPSRLPVEVQRRAAVISETVMRRIGFEDRAFNIEFFWNPDDDKLWLLEINPRTSQSHAYIFEQVDGVSNHHMMIEAALGRRPHMPSGEGPAGCAAKFMLRAFEDGVVHRVPTELEKRHVERRFPGTEINVHVKPGDRLSSMLGQDSYSYVLAEIFMAAENTDALLDRYAQCLDMLPFDMETVGAVLEASPDEGRQPFAA